jgi:hypothetical protein
LEDAYAFPLFGFGSWRLKQYRAGPHSLPDEPVLGLVLLSILTSRLQGSETPVAAADSFTRAAYPEPVPIPGFRDEEL